MRVSVWKVGVVLAAAPLVLGACRGETRRAGARDAGILERDATRALGPGDIRIVSVDSSIEIALIGDSIVTGLAPKALAKIKSEMDTGAVAGTGLGARFEKFVKSNVQSVLDKQLMFPVSSVGEVRFERGKLEFFDNRGKRMASFSSSGSDSSARHGMFAEADGKTFVAAFQSRKAAQAR